MDSLTSGIPADAFVHAVREDKKRKGLLYAGTERGVFFSWDDGATLAIIPGQPAGLTDLRSHSCTAMICSWPRMDAHSGRWMIFLRYSNISLRSRMKKFTSIHQRVRTIRHSVGAFGGGGDRGQNPPSGAVIYYSLKTALKKPGEKKSEEKKPDAAAPAGKASAEGKEPGQSHPANAAVPAKSEASRSDTGEDAKTRLIRSPWKSWTRKDKSFVNIRPKHSPAKPRVTMKALDGHRSAGCQRRPA